MRVMVIVKATRNSEASVMPSEKLLAEMGKYNQELVKAAVMIAGDGLHPSARGKRMRLSGSQRTVIDGPFTETKELIAGHLPGGREAPVTGGVVRPTRIDQAPRPLVLPHAPGQSRPWPCARSGPVG